MTEPRKLRVFLCHSSQDKPVVRNLYQQLSAEGWVDPWLDEEKLLPGQDWDLEIEKAVDAADAVIVCLSNHSVSKEGYVHKELRIIVNKSMEKPEDVIFIIPLRLDDCSYPKRLSDYHFQDYFPEKKKKAAYERLSKSLKTRLAQIVRRENEDKARSEDEKKRRREAQKAARERRRKILQEKELREKMEKEELEKRWIGEKTRLEEEKKFFEEGLRRQKELANKQAEEKRRLESAIAEKDKSNREQLKEKKRLEDNLRKKMQIEEIARKEAETKLYNEIQKQNDLRKRLALENLLRTILGSATLVGIAGFFVVIFLPSKIVGNLISLIFFSFLGGILVSYRLLKKLPDLQIRRAVLICSVSGGVTSLPVILATISKTSSNSYSGWVILSGLIVGVLAGGGFAYFLLSMNGMSRLDIQVKKIMHGLSSFTAKLFDILLRFVVLFAVSFLFSIISWVLKYKQQNGSPTALTELVTSRGTEMALLNAGFLSIVFVLFSGFVALRAWLSKKGGETYNVFDSIGCQLVFLLLLIRLGVLGFGFLNKFDLSYYYWIGVFLHPLYLVALDFWGSNLFLPVFALQLIPLFLLDVFNINILGFFVELFEIKSKVQVVANNGEN